MNYVFIYNPNAGLRSDSRLKDYMTYLERIPQPNTYELLATAKKGDAEQFARETAQRDGTNAIVIAVGGDGTLSEVANGLAGTDTPLLVLPAGRGNDFSRTLYAKDDRQPEVILEALALFTDVDISSKIRIYDIDLLSVKASQVSYPQNSETEDLMERYSINAVSIGFDSKSVIASDRLSRRFSFIGNNIYYLGALISSFSKMKFRFNFSIDGTVLHDRAYSLAAICNARYYGSGFLPNPKGHLRDGFLETIVSKPVNLWHVIMMAKKYKAGRIDELAILDAFKGRVVTIESTEKDKLVATIDGDAFYCKRIEISSVRNKLKVILPSSFAVPEALS